MAGAIASRYAPPGAAMRWVMRGLAFAALAIAAYLTSKTFGVVALPGCGPRSGCDQVLRSGWSQVFGVSVSIGAILMWLGVLLALGFVSAKRSPIVQRRAWAALIGLSVLALCAAAWFTALQVIEIKAMCPYCMAHHGAATVCAGLLLWRAPIGRPWLMPGEPRDPLLISPGGAFNLILMGVIVTVLLATMQVKFHPETYIIARNDKGDWITLNTYPTIGAHDAPHKILYFFDYTCSHCRRMHQLLLAAKDRWGDKLVIAFAPVPQDAACNSAYTQTHEAHANACEYAMLALGVWRTRPDRFEPFDHFIQTGNRPPPIEQARQKAAQLIGKSALDQALQGGWTTEMIREQIRFNDSLRETLNRGSQPTAGKIPTLFIDQKHIVTGLPETTEKLFELLEQMLGKP